jgi:hypothetical protein
MIVKDKTIVIVRVKDGVATAYTEKPEVCVYIIDEDTAVLKKGRVSLEVGRETMDIVQVGRELAFLKQLGKL